MRHHWKPLRTRLTSVRVHSRGYLPHWKSDGAVYSVTARLADSLPAHVLDRLRRQHLEAVADCSRSGDLTAVHHAELELVHALRVDEQLDRGYGSCILGDPRVAAMVLAAVRYFDTERYELIAACVMPNHLHLVLRPLEEWSLSSIMHSIKRYTSREANRILGSSGRNWQHESFDRIIRDAADLERTVRYVLENPDKAHLGEDWPWRYASCRLETGGTAG